MHKIANAAASLLPLSPSPLDVVHAFFMPTTTPSPATPTSPRGSTATSQAPPSTPARMPPAPGRLASEALSIVVATKTKGKNFSSDEDVALAAAWLDASQDPIVGDEQRGDAFWTKVHGVFSERLQQAGLDAAQRPPSSLKTRWRTLQAACNKFAGCYAAVVTRNESGKTIEDKIVDSHRLYREQQGSIFKSQDVWVLLRHSPKWLDKMTAKRNQKRRASVDVAADVFIPPSATEGATQHTDARPIGRKAAKKSAENERAVTTMLAKIAKETGEKNRLLREATREQIMARRLDGMSATQQRYYQIKQEQILAELETEMDM